MRSGDQCCASKLEARSGTSSVAKRLGDAGRLRTLLLRPAVLFYEDAGLQVDS